MADENKADFRIHGITGASPKKDVPVDFVIHGVTGIDHGLKEGFVLHGIRRGESPDDFIIHPQVDTQPVIEPVDFTDIVTRETQPIPREMPTLENTLVIGEFDASRIPVFMSAETFLATQQHLSSLLQSQTPFLELAGAPIGRYCVDNRGRRFVEILAYVPFSTESTSGDVQIPAEEHLRAIRIMDDLRTKGLNVNIIAGWVHSHPRMTAAPSDTDVTTANSHYRQDYMSTIIFDPINKQIGVFEPNGQGGLRNKGGLVVIGDNRQIVQGINYCQREHL